MFFLPNLFQGKKVAWGQRTIRYPFCIEVMFFFLENQSKCKNLIWYMNSVVSHFEEPDRKKNVFMSLGSLQYFQELFNLSESAHDKSSGLQASLN